MAAKAPPAPAPAPEPPKPADAKKETLDEWRNRNPEPDREKDLAGWLVWNAEDGRKWREDQNVVTARTQEERRVDGLVTSARQEIEQLQAAYKKTNPDYDNALNHAKAEYTRAIKTLMPQMSDAQVSQAIDKEIFNLALKCNRDGTNLGEVLYDMSIERFGYEPGMEGALRAAAQKPNLRVVANNKRKSASPIASGGGEGAKPRVTMAQAADMSPEELMALDASDWEYLNQAGF